MSDNFIVEWSYGKEYPRKKEQPVTAPGQHHHALFVQKPTGEHRYEIKATSVLTALGSRVVDMSAVITWLVNKLGTPAGGLQVNLTVEKQDIQNEQSVLNGLIDFTRLFNIPTQKMAFLVDRSGAIVKILNQQQVYERWMQLKQEQLLQMQADDELEQLLLNGDQEFSDTLPVIKNSLLHVLFFPPVFGRSLGEYRDATDIGKRLFNSQLFQHTIIPADIKQELLEDRNGMLRLLHTAKIPVAMEKELQKQYKQHYQPLLGPEFNYNLVYRAEYVFEKETGLLKSCQAVITETANKALHHKATYHIQLI